MKRALMLIACMTLSACQSSNISPETMERRAESHYQLGLSALQTSNLPRAFDELMQAQELAPKRPEILDALGLAWRIHGNLKRSEEFYLKAVKLDPPSETYINYGSLLLQLKRPEEAEIFFRKALDDPRYRNPDLAYLNLGDALFQQGKDIEAIAAYRQAAVLNPREGLPQLREAGVYIRQGREQYALAIYEVVLQKNPGSRDAMQGMINLLPTASDPVAIMDQLRTFRDKTSNPLDRAWADEQLRELDRW